MYKVSLVKNVRIRKGGVINKDFLIEYNSFKRVKTRKQDEESMKNDS
ncbi:hypothetical protein HpCS36_05100 [Helicobacter pylori]